MPRLPVTGQDVGIWGQLLNEFLLRERHSDGRLRIRTDGTLAPAPITDAGSNAIQNVADPTGPQDAATKAYVDNAVQSARVTRMITVMSIALG